MYEEVEGELANFANLYVATSQLHSARSVRSVLRALKELLAQLLGAAAFAVYFVSDDGEELVAIASEGVDPADVARVPATHGPDRPRLPARRGRLRRRARHLQAARSRSPSRSSRCTSTGGSHGVIAIFGTLPQKTEFVTIDRELFKLLGAAGRPRARQRAPLHRCRVGRCLRSSAFVDLED